MFITSDEAEAQMWLDEYEKKQRDERERINNLPPIHQSGESDFY